MIPKLLAAAALLLGLLGASAALAQTSGGQDGVVNPASPGDPDSTRTGSTSPEDLSAYLSGQHVRPFYADDGMSTLRPDSEVRETFNALSLDERMQLRAACAVNENPKYQGLCSSVRLLQ